MDTDPTLLRDTRGILVESIWWDARTDELVWVDITAGTLHRGPLDGAPDGGDDRVVRLPPPVSAVQPAAGGGYVATLEDSVVMLDAAGAITRTIAAVEHAHRGMRFNEAKVDPFGRLLVGSMDVTDGSPDGALYSVAPDGSVRTLRGGFAVTNGIEWSDAGDVMYVTDTSTLTVYRGAYGPDGELRELEPFLTGRSSDGLARAIDGSFLNGLYGEGRVVRWDGAGGIADEWTLPAPNITSVAFGGPAYDILLVGSARENLDEDQLARHPRSGAIFRIDGVGRGSAPHVFAARP
ncbi:SMP-30/gluconolactonase/LRE family protein [Microbacterium sp. NPDC078428]|uniref:SMP-30/gluconolactonase/LRE family protein n=1 Tax=Microbacterium sp. NPDC078428 TaxID=3364190 RepID=UPI0037C9DAAD